MVVPTGVVVPLFLATFVLTCVQYYRVDPRRRVMNARFALMACAFLGAFSYPLLVRFWSGEHRLPPASFAYLAAGILCLTAALYLLRRMPQRDRH